MATFTDVLDVDAAQIDTATLPLRDSRLPSATQFRVALTPEVHADMWEHASASLADGELVREVGGFLIGDLYRDERGPCLDVTSVIAATHTRNEQTEVTFTPETWAEVNRIKDTKYPDRKIVGWYHTHPNFGVFLSERDCFVHRHSFSQPWAIAWVIDPIQKQEGLFTWQKGEPREANEFWIGRELRQRTKATAQPRAEEPVSSRTRRPTIRSTLSELAPLAVVAVALGALGYVEYRRREASAHDQMMLARVLESERMELARASQLLDQLRPELDSTVPAEAFHPPLQEPTHAPNSSPVWAGRFAAAAQDLRQALARLQKLNVSVSDAVGLPRNQVQEGKETP